VDGDPRAGLDVPEDRRSASAMPSMSEASWTSSARRNALGLPGRSAAGAEHLRDGC
jgi:hypothetical protein